jgi:hypothetical protein
LSFSCSTSSTVSESAIQFLAFMLYTPAFREHTLLRIVAGVRHPL